MSSMEEVPAPSDINEAPELVPVELPGRDSSPTVEDRLSQIESVLKINP